MDITEAAAAPDRSGGTPWGVTGGRCSDNNPPDSLCFEALTALPLVLSRSSHETVMRGITTCLIQQ